MKEFILDWAAYLFTRPQLTLVTASDESHARSLLQLVQSVKRTNPDCDIIVYDLGLAKASLDDIDRVAPYCKVRRFEYELYPEWFDIKINAGEYAWKPTIIATLMNECTGTLIWMDAGNFVTGSLARLQGCALRYGIFSQPSSGDLLRWTHPSTLRYFGKDASWAKGRPNINGACIAIRTESPIAKKAISEWSHLAKIREVIAPNGSSRSNHRQDQALLSVILNVSNFKKRRRNQKSLNFDIHRDVD